MQSTRILILKASLIGKTWHVAGDVVECDAMRAKYLIRKGHASEIKVTGARASSPEPKGDEKREATARPKPRKAALDV